MPPHRQTPVRIRTGQKTSIWLALIVALCLHGMIIFLPVSRQITTTEHTGTRVELQLTAFVPSLPEIAPEVLIPNPEIEPEPEPVPAKKMVEAQPDIVPPALAPIPPQRELEHDLENMSEQHITRLTNTILSSQFISEESEADRLFGKSIGQNNPELRREFHYPVQQNMIAMLDQPMSELPFA